MSRTDRLRAEVRQLAPAGDTPEFRAAFDRFMAASIRRPWWERALSWYMELPHNRRVILSLLDWLNRHRIVALPLAVCVLTAEVLLLR